MPDRSCLEPILQSCPGLLLIWRAQQVLNQHGPARETRRGARNSSRKWPDSQTPRGFREGAGGPFACRSGGGAVTERACEARTKRGGACCGRFLPRRAATTPVALLAGATSTASVQAGPELSSSGVNSPAPPAGRGSRLHPSARAVLKPGAPRPRVGLNSAGVEPQSDHLARGNRALVTPRAPR
jgi:hypothetical protein